MTSPEGAVPEAVRLVEATLESMGVESYDDAVVLQLLEAFHGHIGDVKRNAHVLAQHFNKNTIDPSEVQLAASQRMDMIEPRFMSINETHQRAREINSKPLPLDGAAHVRLPPPHMRTVGLDAADASYIQSLMGSNSNQNDTQSKHTTNNQPPPSSAAKAPEKGDISMSS